MFKNPSSSIPTLFPEVKYKLSNGLNLPPSGASIEINSDNLYEFLSNVLTLYVNTTWLSSESIFPKALTKYFLVL
jgi:hypothetical protein